MELEVGFGIQLLLIFAQMWLLRHLLNIEKKKHKFPFCRVGGRENLLGTVDFRYGKFVVGGLLIVC